MHTSKHEERKERWLAFSLTNSPRTSQGPRAAAGFSRACSVQVPRSRPPWRSALAWSEQLIVGRLCVPVRHLCAALRAHTTTVARRVKAAETASRASRRGCALTRGGANRYPL